MRKYDIFEWRTVHFFRGGLSKQGGHGGQALQILTDQLTLSQPGGGGDYTYQIIRPSYGPAG